MIDQRQHVAPGDPNNPWFTNGAVDYDRVHGTNPAGGQYPKMLFRCPGDEPIHGVKCDTLVVDTDEQEEVAREAGYRVTPKLAAKAADDAEPKRGPGRPPKSVDTGGNPAV